MWISGEKQMHILIIPSWYPQFSGDVGGSFFREQAIALKKVGHSVGVIYPQVRSLKNIKSILKKPYGLTVENDEGVNTLRWYTANYFPKVKNYNKSHWIKIGLRLFELYVKKYGKPDIIHVHSMLNAGYVAEFINEKYNIPYVITEHSTNFARNLVTKDSIQELRGVVDSACFTLSVSSEFSKLLNDMFKTDRWHYIPNIVNDDFINYELLEMPKNKFTFINVCFLNDKKRVDILISAFANAFKGNNSVDLKIGGSGPLISELKLLAQRLGVSSQIKFLGNLTRKEVLEEISTSNAFVLSSEYETFGVVIIEALALGKPVIATRCGGPESIIIPEVGYLISKNSVNELSEALHDLYNNYNNYNPIKLREYCYQNFSEKVIVGKLTRIYSECII